MQGEVVRWKSKLYILGVSGCIRNGGCKNNVKHNNFFQHGTDLKNLINI
jgi:hypothetical protein